MTRLIYKIVPETLWSEALDRGVLEGAPVDLQDGYIHFSTAGQLDETASRHFSGQTGLLLVAVDTGSLGDALKYEPSRGGDLFPHLYAPLRTDAAAWVRPIATRPDGGHDLPELE